MDQRTRRGRRRRTTVAGVGVMLALVATACGDDDGDDKTATNDTAPTEAAATEATTAEDVTEAATDSATEEAAPTEETEAPTATPTPEPAQSALEVLQAAGVSALDVGLTWEVFREPHDLPTSPEDLRPFTAAVPECAGIEDLVPVPYATLQSAARIDFAQPTGPADALLVAMPDEAGAVAFMTSMRETPAFIPCLEKAVAAYLEAGWLPEGVAFTVDDPREGEAIAGYGDDQFFALADAVVTSGGTEIARVPAGSRYSRLGSFILVAGGASEMDGFAPIYYERIEAVLNGSPIPPAAAPQEGPASEASSALALLARLDLAGADFGEGVEISEAPHEVGDAAIDLQAVIAGTPSCAGIEDIALVPWAAMDSGARLVAVVPSGALAMEYVVVMPSEDDAIAYLEQLRATAAYPKCLAEATATLTGQTMSGTFGFTAADPRLGDLIEAFGDDQFIVFADYTLTAGDAVITTVTLGQRYSRVGEVIIMSSGSDDSIAPLLYERVTATAG